ncbi:hypothetical protein A2U01_0091118, partial [Trifolium medium]|nr:hypothetical protein [Trifolium medium]
MIQKGYARKYVKERDRETNEAQMAIDTPATDDEENRTAVSTTFAITRLDDFLPLCNPDEDGLLKHLTAHMDGSWENFPKSL